MSFISLLFGLGATQTQIGALSLDALLNEETTLSGSVTRYPVETGSDPISDHISSDGETLSLSGTVTAAGVTMFGGGGRSKLISAKEVIRQINEQRIPITIVTGMEVYTLMGMENATVGRSGSLEKISIDCSFRKIVMVETRTVEVPPKKAAKSVKGKAGATGSKAGKVSPPSDDKTAPSMPQSTLRGLIRGKQGSVTPPAVAGGMET